MRTLTLEAKYKGDKYTYILVATDDRHIPVGEAGALFAQRIVTCVNALENIPTKQIEDGIIETAMRAMVTLHDLQNPDNPPFGPPAINAEEQAGVDEYNEVES